MALGFSLQNIFWHDFTMLQPSNKDKNKMDLRKEEEKLLKNKVYQINTTSFTKF